MVFAYIFVFIISILLFVTGYIIVLEIKKKLRGDPDYKDYKDYNNDKKKLRSNGLQKPLGWQNKSDFLFPKSLVESWGVKAGGEDDEEARTLNLSVDIESFYKSKIIPDTLGEFKSAVIPFSESDQEVFKDIQAQIKNRNANVFMKVRLLDLVKPLGKRSQISSIKSSLEGILVDFVVCDRASGKVLFTVQNIVRDLNEEEKRIQKMISKVLDNAGITNITLDESTRENEYYLEREISKLEFN